MKVELNLKKSDRSMSAWEISKFLNSLNSKYYKIDLLNTIATMSKNDDIEFFIMNDSFSLENHYRYMKKQKNSLEDSINLIRLYYLGIPIPMDKNNLFLKKLSYYFMVIRRLNSEFYKYKLPKIEKDVLPKIYFLIQRYLEKLKVSSNLNELDTKIVAEIRKVCEKNFENFIIKDKKDDNNLKKLKEKVENILFKLNISKLDTDFFKILNNLERPVIGIYYKNEKSFEILCRYSVSSEVNSKEQMDIKKIEHNSPTTMIIFAGMVSLLFLIPLLKSFKLKKQKSKMDNDENKKNIEKLENKIRELEEKSESEKIEKISEVENKNMRTNLEKLKDENVQEIEKLLKINKFLNESFEINIKQ